MRQSLMRATSAGPNLAGNSPHISVDLLWPHEAQRSGTDAGQNKQAQSEMRKRTVREGGLEHWDFPPVESGDALRYVSLFAKQGHCLCCGLQVHGQT